MKTWQINDSDNRSKNNNKIRSQRPKAPHWMQAEMTQKSFEKVKSRTTSLNYNSISTDKNKQNVKNIESTTMPEIPALSTSIHYSSKRNEAVIASGAQTLDTNLRTVHKAPWLLRKEKKLKRSKARAEKRKRRKNRPDIPLWILKDLGAIEYKGNIMVDAGSSESTNANSFPNDLQSFVARSRKNASIDSLPEKKPVLKVPRVKIIQPINKNITEVLKDLKISSQDSKQTKKMSDTQTQSAKQKQLSMDNLIYAMKEIILSEKRYVSDLETTIDVFQNPLEKMVKNNRRIRNKWAEEIKMIFRFTRHVHQISTILLKELDEIDFDKNLFGTAGDRRENTPLGSLITVFNDMLPYMSIYSAYCSNYGFADAAAHRMQKILRKLEKDNTRLRCRRLGDFIVMPVQRVCRYPILLTEVLKNLSPQDKFHQDFQQLQGKLRDLANLCDEKMEEINECSWMIDIFYRLRDECPNLISRGRYYIDHILADVQCTEFGQKNCSLNVVLFSDCVLLVKGAWSDASSKLEVTARLDLQSIQCSSRGDGMYILTSVSQKSFILRPTLRPVSPGRVTRLKGEDGQITMLDLPSVVFNDNNDGECGKFFDTLSNLAKNLQHQNDKHH